jgi:hypothetical protein
MGLKSGEFETQGKTSILCFLKDFCVDFEVCPAAAQNHQDIGLSLLAVD